MRDIVIIANDIRSTHNVGSLLRTADGFGVSHFYLTGITPYPTIDSDQRLPHISQKLTKQIKKTALGAENSISWSHEDSLQQLLKKLKNDRYTIIGLEQSSNSIKLNNYQPPTKCALLLGAEVDGIPHNLLNQCDDIVEIAMYGQKESFNVVQATAIALFVLREA